jgi:hypothetical protein
MTNKITRRKFLRILPALPLVALQIPGVMPTEPEESKSNVNERLLFLEQERIWTAITDQWQTTSINALLKCFRGCGTMIPKQRYRI